MKEDQEKRTLTPEPFLEREKNKWERKGIY